MNFKNANIKNFIFDFGNVLYEANHKRMISGLASISQNKIIETLTPLELMHDSDYDKFERGEITKTEFLSNIKRKFGISASDEEIIKVWNSCLVGAYDYSLNAIKEFKKLGRLALLSNTDEIHCEYFSRQCADLFNLFDYLYFSHIIHKRKPDLDIYEYTLKHSNFLAEETLFIDDLEANIEAAKKVGMHSYHIKKGNTILDLLKLF